MKFSIERSTHADIDAIEQMYNDLNDTLAAGVNYPGWIKGVYPIRENALEGLTQNNLFVARFDDKIAGSIILSQIPDESHENVDWQFDGSHEDVFFVHTLAVNPEFSKAGVGRKLLGFAEKFGIKNGIQAIRLDVYEHNAPAIKLYESCGYTYIQTVDAVFDICGLDRFKLYEKLI